MSITLAGSMGGLKGLTEYDKESVTKLLTGRLSFDGFRQWFINRHQLRVASLVINNTCNLRCKHCYLQVEKLSGKTLNLKEWKMVLDSIGIMQPGLICVSGKEVFVDPKGPELLLHLREVRERHDKAIRIGFITNGTFLHEHVQTVLAMDPDYLDISLDGMEDDHDAVRGAGSFTKVIPNIEWAAKTFKERFFVSLTIQNINAAHFVETIDYLHRQGIYNVSSVFYKPQPYTDTSLTLSPAQIDQVFTSLHELSELRPQIPIKIMLDLDISHVPSVLSFIRSGWFDINKIKEDENGNFFIRYSLNNDISLSFRLHIIPSGIIRARLTPEGNLLAAGDTLNTKRYSEYALGNVRDFNYNFPDLYNYALHSTRLDQILQGYYNTVLPQLTKDVKDSLTRAKGGVNEYVAA